MNLTNAEYHARPYMSASKMKNFLKSPAHYKAALVNREETPAMRFGTMVHSYALEPEKFDEQYAVFEGDRRTKVGKTEYNLIVDEGLTPVKADEFEAAQLMRHAVKDLIPEGESEVTYQAEIEGVMCQCRIDRQAGNLAYDLKTISDISEVDRSFFSYGYDIQAVFYEMVVKAAGCEFDGMTFVFVEKKAPFDVALREVDPALKPAIERIIRDALKDFHKCVDTDVWNGVEGANPKLKVAEAPAWKMQQYMPEVDLSELY